ncbi:glycoside hydrolase family 3 protein [Pseudoduganella umbonata]|uniref:beta-glucosidase n=1 Tax=Pseudoduganella umbonata TaxID=864828 RepID=A0A4P8HZX3_9BURK|nr:glycoside hydrolase family 3 N-terminal domain-containing protein [Pseudoduganella umbonata]MBB3224111.1 beta-glucosidase [Pseudoduganella umbonata]QCP14025.1 glycoside hydrolase family 3 protein [Pseudoduganella umbonata]
MRDTRQRAGAGRRIALAGAAAALVTGCAHSPPPSAQPELGVRSKGIVDTGGLRFRDANGNGRLDRYEDWRLSPQARTAALLDRMTLAQKAGLMLIDTLNAGCAGDAGTTQAARFVHEARMVRFILRNMASASPDSCDVKPGRNGHTVTPAQLAAFHNAVQAMAEAEPLGIPVLFKDNQRNHYNNDPRFGISSGAGAFTEFPREAGIAAAALGSGSMAPVEALTAVMGEEYRSVGLRGVYAYMADLATEPRWYRVSETFTENADLNAGIMRSLVMGLQGGPLNPRSAVALTMKHFPGGGPQEQGLDPHYTFGKRQVYPGNNFAYHLKPFQAAIDAGVSSIMPYYGVPIGVVHEGVRYDDTGFAFNRQIVTDLLRGKLGFKGYVNSDTGIVTDRAWGLEDRTVPERVAAAVNAGVDLLSGFSDPGVITALVAEGLVSAERVDEAAGRLLLEQFQLGLFENPYVDVSRVATVIGSEAHRAKGMEVQKQSIVLLQNGMQTHGRLLPLAAGKRIYTMGMGRADVEKYGYQVTDGSGTGSGKRPAAAGHDAAIIRVQVTNPAKVTLGYRTKELGADPARPNPRTGKPWGAEDSCNLFPARNPRCADDLGLLFGGAFPWEVNNLSFTTMAASQSWQVTPALADIQAVMNEIGPERTVLVIYFRQPYVLDEASGLRSAAAILGTFGVSDTAVMEVVSGKFKPIGKMPFALADKLEAIVDKQSDVPGYAPADTLYPYGFGMTY